MTDKEKLQKLFDAALKDPSLPVGGVPKRAFPETPSHQPRTPEAPPVQAASTPAPEASAPEQPVDATPKTGVLDDAASTELGALLDEQIAKQRRKRKREALVTAIVLLGLTGGGFAWFVQSPERIEAVTSAIREIRSVGDVKSLVAKYQAALDRIAARSQQIDQASAAMGVKHSAEDDKDPNMDAEMKQMMGGEGKTVGQRNAALQKTFGERAKANGGVPKATAALKEGESFEWNK
jgi:hypothetical protein